MTKMIKQKAEYVFDANTDTSFLKGCPEFIIQIVGWILRQRWSRKIARMSDGQILDMYYQLTQRGENDDFIISESVIRDTDR